MSTKQSGTLKRFRVEGLDCANCANEIETELRKLDGFDGATVSFSTNTVTIPADKRELAQKTISRIEDGARLVERGSEEAQQTGWRVWHIARIVVALLLSGAGLVFQDSLRETTFRWAEYAVFLGGYLLVGWPVLAGAVRNIVRGRVFDELFLMTIATGGAFIIGELAEAVAVMLFYSVGEYVQESAVDRSRRSISSLMDLRPDAARLVSDHGSTEVAPETVAVGAIVEVRPGERFPLDGEITRGESAADTSALTGESVPRSVGPGDTVLAGFVNTSATVRVRVSKPYAESSVSRILELVEDAAARKAPTERFISRLARVYTPIVVGIAAAIAFLPPLLFAEATLAEWGYRALVMLVISCPCALVVSIPLGYFGGIGGASRNGVLVKGGNYLDALTNLSTVVLDKTGTLTHGTFTVVQTEPRNGFSADELVEYAAAAEAHSSHPIARSIAAEWARRSGNRRPTGVEPALAPERISDVSERKGLGVIARVNERTIVAGSDRLLNEEGIEHADCDADGTVVYVAVDGTYAGSIVIADEIKRDAAAAITEIRELGVERVVMLTGDGTAVAARVAAETGVDSYVAELLPEEKVARVEALSRDLAPGERLAFVGDGINDAPVLMRADIGMAMGALGSDAAIEAADVVLMDDRVSGVADAIRVARHTRSVVIQNIVLALAVKGVFLVLGAFGVATMWEAVIADMGTSVLAVLNATRTLRLNTRDRRSS